MSTRSRLRNLTARFKDFATKSSRARAGRGRLPEKRPRQPASAAHFSKLRNKWRRTRDEQAAKIGPRRLRRIVIATVLAFCAYPVLGTLALWTGLLERVLASEDMTVQIENPAWTVFPGRVHLSSVRLLVNGQTQFLSQGHQILADLH